jgi:iron-sulfur cluster assembly accessory protein
LHTTIRDLGERMTNFVLPTKQAVNMSADAVEHFAKIAKDKVVKFGVEGGGCAGFQYSWKILDDRNDLYPDDDITDYDAFTFAVDGASLMMLIGSSVDYITDITGSHIEVINPLATAGCGCGESVRF